MKHIDLLNSDMQIVVKGLRKSFPDLLPTDHTNSDFRWNDVRNGDLVMGVHRRKNSLVVRSRYTGDRDPAIMEVLQEVAPKEEIQYIAYEPNGQMASDFRIVYSE